jgi:hypothetical protein
MKSYQPKTPRAAIAVAAIAMAALTLTLSIVGPASIEAGHPAAANVLATQTSSPAVQVASAAARAGI